MKQDEIALTLSNNLNKFRDFFTNDLQKKVLELDNNVKSSGYYQELKRVSISLEQYIKKEVGLFYVGFLGSYSSGKTSTINSLLNLWGTDNERSVSNNPTDECITLITNQSNVNNVFSFAKEGAISIRTNTQFNTEFLNNIVLMDTPGSGDPNIIESIVRDSLPLCDLIIYTLNATAPFTDIDKPFLIAQQTKLKNIPILFVLTRANEFVKSNANSISNDNFDQTKYFKELKTLTNRINESIGISDFKEEDFIVVDNLHYFNIDILRDRIKKTALNNQDNLIVLHNHKLSYFKSEIKIIHNYYLELSNNKIDKCVKFIDKAKDNIEYFDRQIDISKMKFSSLWFDNIQAFARIFDGTVKSYIDGLLLDLKTNNKLIDTNDYKIFRENIKEKIKDYSNKTSQDIIFKIEAKAFDKIFNLKTQILDIINFDTLSLKSELQTDSLDIKFPLIFPLDKDNYAKNFINLYNEKIRSDFRIVNHSFDKIHKSIQLKNPLDTANEYIIKYKDSALEILDLYYVAVKMYNVVAFSFEVKNYISELGLSNDFDKLESNDPNKAKYDLIAEKALLDNYEESSKDFEKELTALLAEIEPVKNKIEKIYISSENSSKISEIISEISEDEYKSDQISALISETYRELISNLQTMFINLKEDVNKLKQKSRRKLLAFAITPIFLVLIIWLGLTFKDIETPTNFIWTLAIGVFTSIVASMIYSKLDKNKKIKVSRIDTFKEEISKNCDTLITNSFNNFKIKNLEMKHELSKQLQQKWSNIEDVFVNNLIKYTYDKTELEISDTCIALKRIIEQYRIDYSNFHKKILSLFNEKEKFTDKIENIAMQIKEDSIKPSFQLLTDTLKEIETVKKEIEQLEY